MLITRAKVRIEAELERRNHRLKRTGGELVGPCCPEMWCSVLSGGRLSDMANLAWAKNAVLIAAERELEWEARSRAAIAPSNCPENEGVFEGAAPPVAPNNLAATPLDAIHDLRSLLKTLLRRHGFRCIDCREAAR